MQTLRNPKQLPTPQPSAHTRHHLSTKPPAHTRKQKHRVPEKEPLGQKLRTETPAVELQQLGKHWNKNLPVLNSTNYFAALSPPDLTTTTSS
ncbi:MAG: hypothetical protein F6K53_31925 [Moorea sp. SIO4A1]|nr:hypothetical protein [Moorena sp. SIO4A1]